MKISIILISSLLLITHISALNQKTLIESAEFVLNTFGNKPIKTEYNWRDLSPALHEISIHGHSLPVETQDQLELIGFNFSGRIVNRTLDLRSEANDLDQTYDIGIFRFHYTTIDTIIHAVDETDNNSNSIPDYIDIMAETFVHIYNEQINEMGYYRPPGDAWISSYGGDHDYGGSNHYDVYIRRLSSSYYGYVQSEYTAHNTGNNEFSPNVNEQNAFTSYMAMRNNYNGFPNTEIENIQVTAAHEFFHAIQYGYDGYEKPWLLESTAVWMEEEIYDDINDCYQYMYSWFNEPQKSLDHVGGTHWYGSWIFFEYIDEHFGGSDMIENIFDAGVNTNSQNGDYSHEAIDDALLNIGSSFQEALNGMCIANIVMSSNPGNDAEIYSYEEAEDFPVDEPNIFSTVSVSEEDEFEYVHSTSLNQYASQYIKINTDIPIIVTLDTLNGTQSDFGFHMVVEYTNNNYEITSDDNLFIYNSLYDVDNIYIVIVSQDENNFNFDYTLIIEAANTAPKPFSIVSPVFNENLDTFFPHFKWSASKDRNLMDSTLSYNIELGRNPEYMDIIYNVGEDTSFIPDEALFENVIYYWQVYAYDLAENKTYNKNGIHRFLIQTSTPENNLTFTNAYPNPFPSARYSIESIRFSFFIEEYDESVKITVFDLLGRKVTDIFNGILEPGFYDHLSWNGYNKKGNLASSGIYFLIIETEAEITNQKITLLR